MDFHFPKAELHCHLDGCFRLTTIIEIAKERNIQLPTYDPIQLAKFCALERCDNLIHFLSGFAIFEPVISGDIKAIKRITYEAIEDKAANGIAYLELRVSPHFLANCDVEPMLYAKTKGNVRPRDVIEAVCSTTSEASVKFGIEVRIILCTISLLPEWSMEVAKMCKEYSSMGVVGIDIAGEGTEPGNLVQQRHIDAYQFCRDHNIHRTAHAGENGSAEEVEQAMQILNAQRIGHGYHVVDSESVYNEAKARDVHFEVCPRSSYLTASVDPDLTKHPAIRFLKDKVNFSLSTDDPAIQQTTIYDDYNIAQKYFGFSIEDIKLLNILALKSAFVEESVKNELIRKFETEYAKIT